MLGVGLAVSETVKHLPLIYEPENKIIAFKVTTEVLKNAEMFAHVLGLHDLPTSYSNIVRTEIGYINDDFIHNMMTVRLTLSK